MGFHKRTRIGGIMESLKDSIGYWASVGSVWDSVRSSVNDYVWDYVCDYVWDYVCDYVFDSVCDSVCDSILEEEWNQ
jgi:hypothetical protein